MVHQPSPRNPGTPKRTAAVLVLAALLLVIPARLPAQEAVRENLSAAGTAEPIALSADEITTWTEGNVRVFLLCGKAAASQGAVVVRMQQAVAWVDEDAKARSGAYEIDLYGEGSFEVDKGAKATALQGLVRLTTRGDVRINAYGKKVEPTALPTDPLFQRGKLLRTVPLANAALAVTPPASAPQALKPLASAPLPSPPPTFVQSASPAMLSTIVPVQFTPAPPDPPMPGFGNIAPPPPAPPVTQGPIEGTPPVGPRPLNAPAPAPAKGPVRKVSIRPRSSISGDVQDYKLPNDETAWVFTGGRIINVITPGDPKALLDIEADRGVVWTKGNPGDVVERAGGPQGTTTNAMEFYFAGHVEMRYLGPKGQTETLLADEVYYDLGRSVAIALRADLEIRDPKLPYPAHVKADELIQLNAKKILTGRTETYSTILPSDPGLKIELRTSTITETERIRKSIFGVPYIDPKTGEPEVVVDRTITGQDFVVRLEGVPVWYFPFYTGRIDRPLGPLDTFGFNYNHIFGFQTFTTWDMFELLNLKKGEGERWKLFVDYMTARGPALGSEYNYTGTKLFGLTGRFDNTTRVYGILDNGQDVIGSGGDFAYVDLTTTVPIVHPEFRGRVFERFGAQELPNGFSFQGQLSWISDRNYMEQYNFVEFMNDLNQETFAYVKQQQETWAWTVLAEPRLRDWVTETQWLPKVDGYLLGQTIFDRFIYSVRADAGYAQLRPTSQPPFQYLPTDNTVNTGRVDVIQDLSLPLTAGPVKVVPYVKADLTYYSRDETANDVGRAYGGAGVRTNIPFSKLYPDVRSELFNLDGIFHKIVLSGNYFSAWSSVPYSHLPQLDRLNDDVTDFTLRQMHIVQPLYVSPATALNLTQSPVFDPQMYAIRRGLDNRIDTRDSLEVLQLELNQRWQTKRGFPGAEHVVDWMTLDLQGSVFPDTHRDNFGRYFGVLQYDWNWNIGDRTALFSSGWMEPISDGPRVFSFGVAFNRPDTTNFNISYRQIEPVGSRAVIATLTYPFSAKYAVTASTVYDFGANVNSYTVMVTRKGTDVLVGLGFSYNSILKTFGVQFEIIPNLLLNNIRPGATPLTGPGAFSGR